MSSALADWQWLDDDSWNKWIPIPELAHRTEQTTNNYTNTRDYILKQSMLASKPNPSPSYFCCRSGFAIGLTPAFAFALTLGLLELDLSLKPCPDACNSFTAFFARAKANIFPFLVMVLDRPLSSSFDSALSSSSSNALLFFWFLFSLESSSHLSFLLFLSFLSNLSFAFLSFFPSYPSSPYPPSFVFCFCDHPRPRSERVLLPPLHRTEKDW